MAIAFPAAALLPAGLFPFLLLFALAVRFSGKQRILNSVDYSAIQDPVAFHRWAGNRLILLPLSAASSVAACIAWPAGAVAVVVFFFLSVVLIAFGVVGGSNKFAHYGRE